MRRKFISSLLLSMLIGVFMSCNNDSEDFGVDAKQRILLSKYPNAQNVNWTKSSDSKYDIAKFTVAKTRTDESTLDTIRVWFGNNNDIRLIKEEISFKNLPTAVKTAFSRAICRPIDGVSDNSLIYTYYSDPAVWEIDDIYYLEKDGAVSYRIELETASSKNREVEMVLIYDAQGVLLDEYEVMDDDDDYPLEIPGYIFDWVAEFFPNSIILDYEYDIEDGEIEHELDLSWNNIIVEIELVETAGKLFIEELEYKFPNLDTLPLVVKERAIELIDALDFFTIDDICEIEMEISKNGDEVYEIELRNSSKKIELRIVRNSDGLITN